MFFGSTQEATTLRGCPRGFYECTFRTLRQNPDTSNSAGWPEGLRRTRARDTIFFDSRGALRGETRRAAPVCWFDPTKTSATDCFYVVSFGPSSLDWQEANKDGFCRQKNNNCRRDSALFRILRLIEKIFGEKHILRVNKTSFDSFVLQRFWQRTPTRIGSCVVSFLIHLHLSVSWPKGSIESIRVCTRSHLDCWFRKKIIFGGERLKEYTTTTLQFLRFVLQRFWEGTNKNKWLLFGLSFTSESRRRNSTKHLSSGLARNHSSVCACFF